MTATRQHPFLLTAAAAALLVAFPALAQDDDVTQLARPESSLNVGIGYVDKDNQRFGQYNGRYEKGAVGIAGFSLLRREDSSGTWFSLSGRNLGYENRELRLEQERQGDWRYFIEYSRTPRYDPFTVNTGLQGLGTATQTTVAVAPGAGTDYRLSTVRDSWTLGFGKTLGSAWDVQVRYRNEVKDGARLFGQGTFGTTWRFLTDVLDQTTQQVDALANFTTERFQMTAGYYGTLFDNHSLKINTPGGGAPFPEVASPPGNQSHQVYVAGGYNFTSLMRGTFKVAVGRITQEESFPTPPAIGVNSLNGRIDTTLVQAGLSGRATPKLGWRADLRYENRDDKTPVRVYFPTQAVPSTTGTNDGTNEPRDIETTTAKLVGNYSLPMGFRLTGDLTFEQKKRNSPPVRAVDFRERTDETTTRVELRRAVAESVTGAVSVLHSKRDGSDWLPMVANNGVTPTSALIAPLHLIDRTRDTVGVVVNWMPTDVLSLNFRADASRDDYTGRGLGPYGLGPREGRGSNHSVDGAYTFSDRVTATAWYSSNENRYENATCQPNAADACTNNLFSADLRNLADSFGLGLRAKLSSKLDVGADVVDSKVRDVMNTAALAAIPATVPVLPDIHTKVTTFKLFGKYALDRRSGVRVDYVYDRYQTDDWTFANWIYTDGTTVLQSPDQKVSFVGVSYYYRF